MTTMNPFLVQSTLPYLAPHFDQIANHHYRPAFDEGMQQKRAEIAAIALNPQTPDFNNTILALEQSGELLTRVTSVFFAMTAAHTNDELQRLDEQFSRVCWSRTRTSFSPSATARSAITSSIFMRTATAW